MLCSLMLGLHTEVVFDSFDRVEEELDRSEDKILVNFGTVFKHVKKMIASRDQIYLTLSVPLPDFDTLLKMLEENKFNSLDNVCNSEVLFKKAEIYSKQKYINQRYIAITICKTYTNIQTVVEAIIAKTRRLAADKLEILKEYIPGLDDTIDNNFPDLSKHAETSTVSRPKRFLPIPLVTAGVSLAVSGIKTGLDIYRTHKLKKRYSSFKEDVKSLRKDHKHLYKMVSNLYGKIITYFSSNDNRVQTLENRADSHGIQLYNLTTLVSDIVNVMDMMRDSDKLITFSTSAQANQMLILDYVRELGSDIQEILTTLLDAFHLLELGKLPPQLINMHQLDAYMTDLSGQLIEVEPDYVLAPMPISEHYNSHSILWGVTNDSILINIPIMITERDSQPFELFHVETHYVPTEMDSEGIKPGSPQPYTKIKLDYEYIAIKNDVYVLMTSRMIEDCTTIHGTLYCDDLLIHTHKTAPSCLSALYWQNDLDTVTKQCQTMYYHDIIPNPTVFEDKSQIVVTNIDSNWRITCQGDIFPHTFTGKSYTSISKESLCGCEIIIGKNHFLPRTRTGCKKVTAKIKLRQPVNSLMLYKLQDRIKQLTSDFKYYGLNNITHALDIPKLKIKRIIDEHQVLYERPKTGIPLQKVVDMIKSDHEAYLTETDLIIDNQSVDNWFDEDSVENTFTFISGILTIVCMLTLAGLIYVYYTGNRRLATGVSALAYKVSQHQTEATPIISSSQGNPNDDFWFFEIRFRAVVIIAMIISYLLFKLAKYLHNKYFQYKLYIPQNSENNRHFKTHLFVEIFNNDKKEILYLQSIRTALINLTFNPSTTVDAIYLTRVGCLSGQLYLRWDKGYFHILHKKFQFPDIVSVPFFKYRKVRNMMKGEVIARLLIEQDLLYSLEGVYRKQVDEEEGNSTEEELRQDDNNTIQLTQEDINTIRPDPIVIHKPIRRTKIITKPILKRRPEAVNETIAEIHNQDSYLDVNKYIINSPTARRVTFNPTLPDDSEDYSFLKVIDTDLPSKRRKADNKQ